jgi:hypothetical protein
MVSSLPESYVEFGIAYSAEIDERTGKVSTADCSLGPVYIDARTGLIAIVSEFSSWAPYIVIKPTRPEPHGTLIASVMPRIE